MTIAIGDIHGCIDPLQRLVARLPQGENLVFLGDYIDRGPGSSQVIEFIKNLSEHRNCRFIMGNHEFMMKKAVEETSAIPSWLFNGGDATLESYGIDIPKWVSGKNRGEALAPLMAFYQTLEYYFEDDAAIYVHAGLDVELENLTDQRPEVLLWVRDKFFQNSAKWKGKQVVVGHTPTNLLGMDVGRVYEKDAVFAIDTGCVYGGALTALNPGTKEVFQEPLRAESRLAAC